MRGANAVEGSALRFASCVAAAESPLLRLSLDELATVCAGRYTQYEASVAARLRIDYVHIGNSAVAVASNGVGGGEEGKQRSVVSSSVPTLR